VRLLGVRLAGFESELEPSVAAEPAAGQLQLGLTA
jgi:hypothetical protein